MILTGKSLTLSQPQFDEKVKVLTELGLTFNQARIFLALDKLGVSAPVAIISKISGVPREKVYCLMPTLEKLGLVEKVLRTPVEFNAAPLKTATSILLAKKIQETSEIRKRTKALLIRNAEEQKISQNNDEETIVICKKQIGYNERMQAMEAASKCLDILTPGFDLELKWDYFLRKYKKILNHNTQIRIVLQQPLRSKQVISDFNELLINPLFSLRYSDSVSPSMSLYIIDQKQVTIATSTKNFPKDYSVLCTRAPVMVSLAIGYFETVWAGAISSKAS